MAGFPEQYFNTWCLSFLCASTLHCPVNQEILNEIEGSLSFQETPVTTVHVGKGRAESRMKGKWFGWLAIRLSVVARFLIGSLRVVLAVCIFRCLTYASYPGLPKAVLAGVAAVACCSLLLVGSVSSGLLGPSDLLVCSFSIFPRVPCCFCGLSLDRLIGRTTSIMTSVASTAMSKRAYYAVLLLCCIR